MHKHTLPYANTHSHYWLHIISQFESQVLLYSNPVVFPTGLSQNSDHNKMKKVTITIWSGSIYPSSPWDASFDVLVWSDGLGSSSPQPFLVRVLMAGRVLPLEIRQVYPWTLQHVLCLARLWIQTAVGFPVGDCTIVVLDRKNCFAVASWWLLEL